MTSRTKLMRKDIVVVLSCAAFALLCLGAVGAGGRKRAKEAVCLSNLRQWGRIFQIYTNDNDGYFFTGDPGTPGYWWVKQLEECYRDWKRNKSWFCPAAAAPLIDENGNMTPSPNIFMAWGIYRSSGLGPNGISGSYALNGYMITPQHATTYEGGVPVADGWGGLNLTNGANIPLFLEALRFDVWPRHTEEPAVNEYAAWSSNSMARCCINRHVGSINAAFADLSARKVGLKELWKLKWHRSFDTEGPWTSARGVQPTDWPLWMRDFKDN
ncbi:MAG: hypothetical protein JSU94_17985 [Phycisphaerales bacterium]|nr:MAG: hypothetical protein JSU94_17985 [Phycisphaerales bacterium]